MAISARSHGETQKYNKYRLRAVCCGVMGITVTLVTILTALAASGVLIGGGQVETEIQPEENP